MADHDRLCPASIAGIEHRLDICRCEEYARVRADERECRRGTTHPVTQCCFDAGVLADLRDRIADDAQGMAWDSATVADTLALIDEAQR